MLKMFLKLKLAQTCTKIARACIWGAKVCTNGKMVALGLILCSVAGWLLTASEGLLAELEELNA